MQLELIEKQILQTQKPLADLAYADEQVRLLMTLPGVGAATALALKAALGDIARFPSPDQAAAYLGLVPSTSQSGDKAYHGRITKRGNSHARWMLTEAAQSVQARVAFAVDVSQMDSRPRTRMHVLLNPRMASLRNR